MTDKQNAVQAENDLHKILRAAHRHYLEAALFACAFALAAVVVLIAASPEGKWLAAAGALACGVGIWHGLSSALTFSRVARIEEYRSREGHPKTFPELDTNS